MDYDSNMSEEALSRREREKLAHRAEIIDAALRVFARKGFFQATLDGVAQEAEFSKGALYLYFSSKEDILYIAMKEKLLNFNLNLAKDALKRERTFYDELKNYFVQCAIFAYKEQDLMKVLIAQMVAGYKVFTKEKAEEFITYHRQLDATAMQCIENAKENGELRALPSEAIYGMIHGSLENMLVTRWGSETVDDLIQSIDVFLDILFNGIGKNKEN
jgi:TetR/AcrR family fatty acid metabolism transcriptional regulator